MMIDPDDPEGFTSALEKALKDTTWRKGAVRQGLTVAAAYDWDQCAQQTLNVYRHALSLPAPTA